MLKSTQIRVILFICLCAVISLAVYAFTAKNSGSFNIAKVTAMELQAPVYGEQDSSAVAVASGANDFVFRLSAALAQNVGSENFVCSPYSVWLPLAALINATDAPSKAALLSALGAPGMTEADINRAASRMLYDLTNFRYREDADYYHNPLRIANAIFVGNNVTLEKDFSQAFMDYYRGSAINVDFSSRDAVEAVNRWASENTDGLITDLIQQEFDPLTVATIANAIYFSDRWTWEFNPEETAEGIFHAPSGDTAAFYMLREGDIQVYYEDGKIQAMPLSFTGGGGLYILLPKTGGAAELLSSMTSAYFNEIQTAAVYASGKLLLPRFSIANGIKGLKNSLETLGVPLFNQETAPLTGGLIKEDTPLWLSDAIQKAVIKVDEKGTTAAAVTVMGVGMGSPQPTDHFEMNCDKPFVFILYEHTYDGGSQILFTGIVNQP
jgi:serpin B